MINQRISRAKSTPNPFSHWKYDVFLSFRGEDTRKNFTSHLYTALIQSKVNVFIDDKQLESGKCISPELLEAIEESRFSIIVFSENYAFSTWCLDELVKIVQCMHTRGQTVFPVFYNVNPSVVRKQTKKFREAFAQHKASNENKEKVQTWRNALVEVTNRSGFHLEDRDESQFIQEIVKQVSSKLRLLPCMNLKDLVGIDSRLEQLNKLISVGSDDIRMIGIWGRGGVGKTTIARVVYELISCEFEGSSFLANVREISEQSGLISLQKQLLSQILGENDYNICNDYDGIRIISSRLQSKRVLVVLDDVVDEEHLNRLARNHDWFGSGSRIIITTRVKNLLTSHGVDEVYEAKELNDEEAFEIFISKAFMKNRPPGNFLELSKSVVKYAGGVPLVLEVLGCFLSGKNVHIWEDALKRLKSTSENEILDKLRISFDGLEESEKKIFLDIACFFKGKNQYYVKGILESCDFPQYIGVCVLIDKSLLGILDDNTFWMHDLLQEMGRQIVKRESLEEPGKRSRLWEEADVLHVLTKDKGTELIEGIMLEKELHVSVSAKAFSKMINLRLLEIHIVQLPKGLNFPSKKLQLLRWHGYPLKSLPSSSLPDEIVELEMNCSHIEQLPDGIKRLNMLTCIHLKDCHNLKKIPDIIMAPNLEELYLEGCPRLLEIYSPLLVHKKLIHMKVSNCSSLTTLPSKIHMGSLEVLDIFCCEKVEKFPKIVGNMERLWHLRFDGTAIKDVPLSIDFLPGLQQLILTNNNDLATISIDGLRYFEILDPSGSSNLVSLPSIFNGLNSLKCLSILCHFNLASLPDTINGLRSLQTLNLSGCSKVWCTMLLALSSLSSLGSLTRLDLSDCNIGNAEIFRCDIFDNLFSLVVLDLSKNIFFSLPASIKHLPKLQLLYLNDCKRLQSFPELPSNTSRLEINGCSSLRISSNALKPYSLRSLSFSCVNCFKLFDCNNSVFSMLQDFLTVVKSTKESFNMVVPGREIPKWLKHQSEGYSINIDMSPDLHNNLVGYVVCSVFVVHEHIPVQSSGTFGTHELECFVEVDGRYLPFTHVTGFNEKFGNAISEHQWLLYLSHELFIDKYVLYPNVDLQKRLDKKYKYNHIKFYITTKSDLGFEVKKCAAHPIYEQDLKGFSSTIGSMVNVATIYRSTIDGAGSSLSTLAEVPVSDSAATQLASASNVDSHRKESPPNVETITASWEAEKKQPQMVNLSMANQKNGNDKGKNVAKSLSPRVDPTTKKPATLGSTTSATDDFQSPLKEGLPLEVDFMNMSLSEAEDLARAFTVKACFMQELVARRHEREGEFSGTIRKMQESLEQVKCDNEKIHKELVNCRNLLSESITAVSAERELRLVAEEKIKEFEERTKTLEEEKLRLEREMMCCFRGENKRV